MSDWHVFFCVQKHYEVEDFVQCLLWTHSLRSWCPLHFLLSLFLVSKMWAMNRGPNFCTMDPQSPWILLDESQVLVQLFHVLVMVTWFAIFMNIASKYAVAYAPPDLFGTFLGFLVQIVAYLFHSFTFFSMDLVKSPNMLSINQVRWVCSSDSNPFHRIKSVKSFRAKWGLVISIAGVLAYFIDQFLLFPRRPIRPFLQKWKHNKMELDCCKMPEVWKSSYGLLCEYDAWYHFVNGQCSGTYVRKLDPVFNQPERYSEWFPLKNSRSVWLWLVC